MSSSFYSLVFRQKYIKRWGLMRNVEDETLSDHANDVAVLAHALAQIGNTFFGRHYDTGKAVIYALFHDRLNSTCAYLRHFSSSSPSTATVFRSVCSTPSNGNFIPIASYFVRQRL